MTVLDENVLGPQLLGEDPTRVEFLWEKMYSASSLSTRSCARSLLPSRGQSRRERPRHRRCGRCALGYPGKSLGVPIYDQLDGGVRERLPAYAVGAARADC